MAIGDWLLWKHQPTASQVALHIGITTCQDAFPNILNILYRKSMNRWFLCQLELHSTEKYTNRRVSTITFFHTTDTIRFTVKACWQIHSILQLPLWLQIWFKRNEDNVLLSRSCYKPLPSFGPYKKILNWWLPSSMKPACMFATRFNQTECKPPPFKWNEIGPVWQSTYPSDKKKDFKWIGGENSCHETFMCLQGRMKGTNPLFCFILVITNSLSAALICLVCKTRGKKK